MRKRYSLHICIALFVLPATVSAQQLDSLALPIQQQQPSKLKPIRFSIRQTQIPVGLVVAGLLANPSHPKSFKNKIVEQRNENMPNFRTCVDNYLQYSPYAIAYGLDAFGVKSKTDILNRSVILLKGQLLMMSTVKILKRNTDMLRPDGSNYYSFPSGHTAQAFAAATFLSEEYKDRFPWMPAAAYGLAGTVGMLRMANNKHYISDVLAGAGIGILTMKVAYWTHQYKWGTKLFKKDRPVVIY